MSILNRHWLLWLFPLWLLSGCASLAPPVERVDEYTPGVTGETDLDRQITKVLEPFPGQAVAHVLYDGLDAFAARLAVADRASRSLDAQYYLFHGDVTGMLFADRLLSVAERGVPVRLLVDDMDMQGRDPALLSLDAHPNIDIRVFNPFANRGFRFFEYLYRYGDVTRRMHNKAMIVDGVVAITGGRNIGDEYFKAGHHTDFRDMDVMIFGPVVREISREFDDYWNSAIAYPVTVIMTPEPDAIAPEERWFDLHSFAKAQLGGPYLNRLAETAFFRHLQDGTSPLSMGPAQVFFDEPHKIRLPLDDDSTHMGPDLWPLFQASTSELLIFNPYFIPGKAGVELLANLVRQGSRVIVLTNSLASNDVVPVHGHYAKYRKPLLRAGIELFELKVEDSDTGLSAGSGVGSSPKVSLHLKTFVFNREKTFIGSLNLDPRSILQNTEMGVVIENPDLATKIADAALDQLPRIAYQVRLDETDRLYWQGYDRQTGQWVRYDAEPDASLVKRLFAVISRILPIEKEL